MALPYSLSQSSKGTAGFGQAVVKILADCGITGDDATHVSEVFAAFRLVPSMLIEEDCMPHVEGVGTTPQSSSG